METVREALAAIRSLIEDPIHWTQGRRARAANGEPRLSRDRDAIKWCVDGAAVKTCPVVHPNDLLLFNTQVAMDRSAFELFGALDAITVNDDIGHAAVLRMLDHAIAAQPRETA